MNILLCGIFIIFVAYVVYRNFTIGEIFEFMGGAGMVIGLFMAIFLFPVLIIIWFLKIILGGLRW